MVDSEQHNPARRIIVSLGKRDPKVLQKDTELQSMAKWTQNSTPTPSQKKSPPHNPCEIHNNKQISWNLKQVRDTKKTKMETVVKERTPSYSAQHASSDTHCTPKMAPGGHIVS